MRIFLKRKDFGFLFLVIKLCFWKGRSCGDRKIKSEKNATQKNLEHVKYYCNSALFIPIKCTIIEFYIFFNNILFLVNVYLADNSFNVIQLLHGTIILRFKYKMRINIYQNENEILGYFERNNIFICLSGENRTKIRISDKCIFCIKIYHVKL